MEKRLVKLTRSLGGDALAHLRRQTTRHLAIFDERRLRRLSRAQQELAAEVDVLTTDAAKAESASRPDHRSSRSRPGQLSGRWSN